MSGRAETGGTSVGDASLLDGGNLTHPMQDIGEYFLNLFSSDQRTLLKDPGLIGRLTRTIGRYPMTGGDSLRLGNPDIKTSSEIYRNVDTIDDET